MHDMFTVYMSERKDQPRKSTRLVSESRRREDLSISSWTSSGASELTLQHLLGQILLVIFEIKEISLEG